MAMHVKKGDKVKILTGKDKGKTGAILRALPKENKVVVEGVALSKRHRKKVGNQSGRIVERPMPIHVSNVAKVTK
jgi:large subunit ribosomal protein L24